MKWLGLWLEGGGEEGRKMSNLNSGNLGFKDVQSIPVNLPPWVSLQEGPKSFPGTDFSWGKKNVRPKWIKHDQSLRLILRSSLWIHMWVHGKKMQEKPGGMLFQWSIAMKQTMPNLAASNNVYFTHESIVCIRLSGNDSSLVQAASAGLAETEQSLFQNGTLTWLAGW